MREKSRLLDLDNYAYRCYHILNKIKFNIKRGAEAIRLRGSCNALRPDEPDLGNASVGSQLWKGTTCPYVGM